jgi:hypothetical protein
MAQRNGLSKSPADFLSGKSPATAANQHQLQNNPSKKNAAGYQRQPQMKGGGGLQRAIQQTSGYSGTGTEPKDNMSKSASGIFNFFKVGTPSLPVSQPFPGLPGSAGNYTDEHVHGGGSALTNYSIGLDCRVDPVMFGISADRMRAEEMRRVLPEGTLLFRFRLSEKQRQGIAGRLSEGEKLFPLSIINFWLRAQAETPVHDHGDANSRLYQSPALRDPGALFRKLGIECGQDFLKHFSFHGVSTSCDVNAMDNGAFSSCRLNYTKKGACQVMNVWGRSEVCLIAGMHLWLVFRKVLRGQEDASLGWGLLQTHTTFEKNSDKWYFQLIPVSRDSAEFPLDLVYSPDGNHGTAIHVGRIAKDPQIDPVVARGLGARFAKMSNTFYPKSGSMPDPFESVFQSSHNFPPLEIHLGA